MSLESALETRYFADEERFSRLHRASVAFFNALHASACEHSSASELATTAAHQSFLLELQSFEAGVGRAAVVLETNRRERGEYDASLAETAKLIDAHRTEIATLKTVLADERIVRRNKEEYEALAHVINTLPPRDATERQIAELNAEIDALSAEKTHLEAETAAKAKHCYAFVAALDQLKTSSALLAHDATAALSMITTATTTATSTSIASSASMQVDS